MSSSATPLAYLGLVAVWAAYGLIHSLLAANRTKAWVAQRLPALASEPLWAWQGIGAWLTNGLAGFWHSSRGYDMLAFMGLRSGAEQPARLVISDWHRHVRHPWYLLALIIIWTRDMDLATLISATAISIYFVVGSRFEERKLIAEFGQRYSDYRTRVPGILPWPGRHLTRAEAIALAGD